MKESFSNYFNYFTEIEEHFQKTRGTSLFLLSPLDWALIETWKNSGVPLEAVLRGIDAAFEKWRAKRSRIQMVNSIAYCAQAVMVETQRMADAGSERPVHPAGESPFSTSELQTYIAENTRIVRQAGDGRFAIIADALDQIATGLSGKQPADKQPDLEALEQSLTAIEQKMIAIARAQQSDEEAIRVRQSLDSQLRPYRGKMTAAQLAMLEQQFMERNVLETLGLPRLSMFYLRYQS